MLLLKWQRTSGVNRIDSRLILHKTIWVLPYLYFPENRRWQIDPVTALPRNLSTKCSHWEKFWIKQETLKPFPSYHTPPWAESSQLPMNCVPRSQLHCHHFRSSPSIPDGPPRYMLISHMFLKEPSSHTHLMVGTEMITLGTMMCDYQNNCLVLTDLHNGGEHPKFCFGDSFPISEVPQAVLVSKGWGAIY